MKAEHAIAQAATEATRHIMEEIDSPTPNESADAGENPVNVGSLERDVSLAAGVVLGIVGLRNVGSIRGLALLGIGGVLLYRGWKGHCPLYKSLSFSTTGSQTPDNKPSAEPEAYNQRGIHVEESVTINRPAADLFRFWRNFENLPRFMNHLKEVKTNGDQRSHWVAKAPLGMSVQWDAEVINEEADKLIAWRSMGNADVDNSGSVRFLPSDDGTSTDVKVTLDYIPPAGQLGSWVAKLFGEEPHQQITDDLNRFKQLVESGELELVGASH